MSKNSKDVSSQVSEQPRHRFSLAETVFTTEEAAEYLRISRAGLYRLVTAKKITSTHIGDRTVFKGRELARYVDSFGVIAVVPPRLADLMFDEYGENLCNGYEARERTQRQNAERITDKFLSLRAEQRTTP